MQVITDLNRWRECRKTIKSSVGFVPTMGNLHAGHMSLMERSLADNEITVLSIFVNPTQFDNPDDLKKYPRTFDADIKLAERVGVNYIFAPDFNALYPDDYTYQVEESALSRMLEGEHRPEHFAGVLTVVMKLLMLVRADHAYFGEKDWQQLQLVRGMVRAFFIDTCIIGCPIVRDEQGVALSSRNNLLSVGECRQAQQFARVLQSSLSCADITEELKNLDIDVEYVTEHEGRCLAAVKVGSVRLIDNKEIVF